MECPRYTLGIPIHDIPPYAAVVYPRIPRLIPWSGSASARLIEPNDERSSRSGDWPGRRPSRSRRRPPADCGLSERFRCNRTRRTKRTLGMDLRPSGTGARARARARTKAGRRDRRVAKATLDDRQVRIFVRRVGRAERHGPILARWVERVHLGLGALARPRRIALQAQGIGCAEPSPGADSVGANPVPAQMWQRQT